MVKPQARKPKRDRVSMDLSENDRQMLVSLQEALKRNTGVDLSDGNAVLCVFRKWADEELRNQETAAERKGK